MESGQNFHPRQFLNCVIETVFLIQLTVRYQTPRGLSAKDADAAALAADDLVPLLSFVLTRTGLKNAFTVLSFCERFADERIRNDEYGNVLVQLALAIENVRQVQVNSGGEAGERV